MAFTGGIPAALQPTQGKALYAGNYIDFTDSSFNMWAQQFLPDVYEQEVERYGNRSIGSFLRMVSAEMPTTSDQIIWTEQGRLHTRYANLQCVGNAGTMPTSGSTPAAVAQAANGGAYPPDMSVLVKARSGGVDYIYSLLQGYEDAPSGMVLDEGVHYNKYMYGNKIKMASPLSEGIVEYGDGTEATVEQMSKDVTTFLMWAAEPHLESRHQMGFKAIIYLIILTILVYLSMKKIWSRIEPEV